MKIDSNPDSYIGSVAGGPQKVSQPAQGAEAANAAQAGAASQAKQAPAVGSAGAQPGVSVSLSSSTADALKGGSSDVFNSEKVEAMKQAIASGTFKANPEAIADKMLSNAAEMLGAAKG